MIQSTIQDFNRMKIRALKIEVIFDKELYPDGLSNTKTIYSASLPNYLHCEVYLNRLPGWLGSNASVVIFGMLNEDITAMTKFNPIFTNFSNQVNVYAGYIDIVPEPDGSYSQDRVTNAIDLLPIIYMGQIVSAGADFNDPNKPFVIQTNVTTQAITTINDSFSVNEKTNASAVVTQLIDQFNNSSEQIQYKLKSISPDTIVNNIHYTGSFESNLKNFCQDYGYQMIVEPSTNSTQLITITRLGQSASDEVNILSPETGLIGYPTIQPLGVLATEYFNNTRSINDKIALDTTYTPLRIDWYVWQMQSTLMTQGEKWESVLTLYGFEALTV